jgi:hypothetical protein
VSKAKIKKIRSFKFPVTVWGNYSVVLKITIEPVQRGKKETCWFKTSNILLYKKVKRLDFLLITKLMKWD